MTFFLGTSRSNRLYPCCRKACWVQGASLGCPVCRGSRVPASAANFENDDDGDDGSTAAADDDDDDDGGGGGADSGGAAKDGYLVVKMLATSAL